MLVFSFNSYISSQRENERDVIIVTGTGCMSLVPQVEMGRDLRSVRKKSRAKWPLSGSAKFQASWTRTMDRGCGRADHGI